MHVFSASSEDSAFDSGWDPASFSKAYSSGASLTAADWHFFALIVALLVLARRCRVLWGSEISE
ncbi:hypothetical protein GN244_ATG01538 [Phytophthora infestans]|uniref:Uncharacterized protein n=1 Tax=Phytophthora infestans TaxID=4787 RepID=A0A833TFX5_PHYIN|nr:hypothetical protein GN244_ATG01538 [Phytophthora infestans]KAF4132909.1 hypothetical protein GN958_ATG17899 [Phytophthora infestans]